MDNIDETVIPPSGFLVGDALLYFTSVFVSLGVFLFGYDQGVMSGIITGPYFKAYFDNPSSLTIGTMIAILEIGALISSLTVGKIGDIIGRRRTIRYGALIFVMGGSFQTLARDMKHMIAGRIISGIAVGLLSTTVPIYQSEISQPHNRGRLSCIQFTGNVFGYLSSVWTDYACTFLESDMQWRIPLLIQCLIGSFLFFGSFLIVETPRWLLNNDHDLEAIVVLLDLFSNGDVYDAKLREEYKTIKEGVLMSRLEQEEKSYSYMFKRYGRRVLILMSSQMFLQFNGINVISYYAPLVFEQAGWVGRDLILMTGVNAVVYVLSTVPPWYLVDLWGRKPILLSGLFIMALSLFSISFVLWLDVPRTPYYVALLVVVFNALFGFSWGPIPWLLPPEILPLTIRGKGASLSTATNWFCNFIVGEMTPILQETIKWKLYSIHLTSCLVSFLVVLLVYPETKGLTLEDMDSVFDDRSSVFSFSSSHRSYGATSNLATTSSGTSQQGNEENVPFVYRSTAALARQPLLDPHLISSASVHSASGLVSSQVGSNSSPFIPPKELEPPTLEEIRAFKMSDANSIRGSLRRGSETVSSMFSKVMHRNDEDGGDEDNTSVAFINSDDEDNHEDV